MGKKGAETRRQIMDTAQAMILERGYGGTSVDNIIRSLGLTKGAFFHHFNSKSDLATALLQRYSDESIATFDEMVERARKLSDDPLQQLSIVVGLYIEIFDGLAEPFPGCLLASYVYELQQFDDDVHPIMSAELLHWRKVLVPLIERIKARYPPRVQVDSGALVDMFLSTFEGAFILSKAMQEPAITAEQLKLYRSFIETLFKP